nr:MAG TPA: hypothetical protein [Caudoviricetes sp.]
MEICPLILVMFFLRLYRNAPHRSYLTAYPGDEQVVHM